MLLFLNAVMQLSLSKPYSDDNDDNDNDDNNDNDKYNEMLLLPY